MLRNTHAYLLLIFATLLLASCGGSDAPTEESEFAPYDNRAEVAQYYADHPDFFRFKTRSDLPTDLQWQDGSELPEIGSPDAKKGGMETIRLQDFPRTLRILGPDSNGSFRPWLLDYTTMALGHRHPDLMDYFPGLATKWAVDREAKTIYVELDPLATWSDGVPITADDYLFMFWMHRSSYITAPWYTNWYSTQYTNITKYDDHLISISTVSEKPDIDSKVLELRPLPRHFYQEVGPDYLERYQWRFPPTTSPYLIEPGDLKKGRSIQMTRNTEWWAKDKKHFRYRFNVDKMNFIVIRDTAKVFEAFKRGDIDQFAMNLAEYWYEKLPNDDADVANGYIHKKLFFNQRPRPPYGLWINTAQPLLDDQNVRLGLQYATNWDLVIETFFRGDSDRLNMANDGYGPFTASHIKARPFDIGRAQEAFARAGFTERGPDGILMREDGTRLAFTISSGYESLKDVLTILKEEAAKAGLEYRVEVLDGTSGWKKVQEKKHEIHFAAFGYSLELYPRFWETYHSDNAYDKAFLDNGEINPARQIKTQTNNLETLAIPEMDRLIDAYRASPDADEMIALAHEMSDLHHDYASFVPGFYNGFFRIGHWRWVNYPADFSHKHASNHLQYFLHWIDEDERSATMDARNQGRAFDPVIESFEQHRSR